MAQVKKSFNDIINSDKPVLIDFYADWCGPCKALAPIIKKVAKSMGDKATVIKIDTERNQALAQKLNIRSIPTVAIFKNGEMKWRQAGVQPESVLMAELEKHL